MSYNASISFKTVPPTEVYPFLVSMKNGCTKEVIKEVAEENVFYSPLSKVPFELREKLAELPQKEIYSYHPRGLSDEERKNYSRACAETETWFYGVFKYRFYYMSAEQCLLVYGVPKSLQHLFDNTVYFQNSTDQDYDWSEWQDCPWQKQIANKWQRVSRDELINQGSLQLEESDVQSDERVEYYRKSCCYSEIWNRIEFTLYKDSEVVYFGLFGPYDYDQRLCFLRHTQEALYREITEIQKEIKKEEKA